jgi:putative endonuclease
MKSDDQTPRKRTPVRIDPLPDKHYVYLARCRNGALYVGYTTNVQRRIAIHNAGRGGRYTRINRPLTLIATWSFSSRIDALRAERAMKRLSPGQKLTMAEIATIES